MNTAEKIVKVLVLQERQKRLDERDRIASIIARTYRTGAPLAVKRGKLYDHVANVLNANNSPKFKRMVKDVLLSMGFRAVVCSKEPMFRGLWLDEDVGEWYNVHAAKNAGLIAVID